MFGAIKRAYAQVTRPLDTSALDEAICEAGAAHTRVRACARALRMDVSCGDASKAIARVVDRMGTDLQRRLHSVNQPMPIDDDPDFARLLGKI